MQNNKLLQWRYQPSWPDLILFGCLLVFILTVGTVKYLSYQNSVLTSDLALYANILWNTGPSQGLMYSHFLYERYGYLSSLQDHFQPTLLLLVPLYQAFPSAGLLVLIQSCLPAVTTLLLYQLGKRTLGMHWLALLPALSYLSYPVMVSGTLDNIYGFHPDSLAPPFIVAAALAFHSRQMGRYLLWIVMAVGVKENIPIIGLLFGFELLIYGRWSKDRFTTQAGLYTLLISGTILAMGLWGVALFGGKLNRHGQQTLSFIKILLENKGTLSLWITIYQLILAWLAPEILLLTVPDVIMYSSFWLPFDWHSLPAGSVLGLASIVGLVRLLWVTEWFASPETNSKRSLLLSGLHGWLKEHKEWLLIPLLILCSWFAGYFCHRLYRELLYPYLWLDISETLFFSSAFALVSFTLLIQRYLMKAIDARHPVIITAGLMVIFNMVVSGYLIEFHSWLAGGVNQEVDMQELKSIMTAIPPDSRLTASSDLMVQLSNRRELLWPNEGRPDYILLNTNMVERDPDVAYVAQVASMLKNREVEVVEQVGSLVLYRVITPPK